MRENGLQTASVAIISVEEIRGILDNFNIGKKPLSKLLGWGETTIIRYIEGDVPTLEYSNKLKTIANDPYYYLDILTQNKDNITGVAFNKSRKAVLTKIMETKLSLVTQYIINLTEGEVCPTYIQWLLYFSQAFSLALYDKELFEDDYIINFNYVPYPDVYNKLKKHGINFLEIDMSRLKSEETKLIEKVVECFSWYGTKALKALHTYERTLLRISRDKDSNKIISKEALKNYFKEVLSYYNIYSLNEIYRYPDQRINVIKDL
ncbi:DUF4065 domain-containing protein [Anaerocolumna aminovalerica]|uniref:Antitoxin SocA-like Panacea domain-containing protein n=1 Tax=Anaerocolumna aminovalerica TaxID=1527 RepID=A0A1I5C7Y2_9FIRM|nr:type II toxin-antitoxin system antitoxin SocA domain-containing protein [Anaerocolumna aminovalerica]MBU5333188.1 hypothetical protein [Anaerocolumna aminovalerica]MDU6263269.1 DUF4065 domain-containing protein [Anaerocolumna aminovalerica]SFN83125.1 hypothetical protein SAMN04489757_102194 [Anaerocolumna aminovalerica]